MERIVEKKVNVPFEQVVEKIVEVPVERIVNKVIEKVCTQPRPIFYPRRDVPQGVWF